MVDACPHVVAIGELLWDVFPDGERLGGAPSNFLVHAAALGANGSLISAVGADDRGDEALLKLGARGLDLSGVSCVPDAQTGTVDVEIEEGQPNYTITRDTAWDQIPWTRSAHDLAASAQLACWGTLCQRSSLSRSAHHAFLGALPPSCLKIFDCNFRQSFHDADTVVRSIRAADILKLNAEEIEQLAEYARAPAARLPEEYGLALVVVTDGEAGCRVIESDGTTTEVAGECVTVVDTVGCGDAFTAALTLALYDGTDPVEAAGFGNEGGAVVATCSGGMPELPETLALWV